MFWSRRRHVEDAISRVLTSQIQREYFADLFDLRNIWTDIVVIYTEGNFHLDNIFDEDKANNEWSTEKYGHIYRVFVLFHTVAIAIACEAFPRKPEDVSINKRLNNLL